MLQPRNLTFDELGDLAEIIPGPEPVLQAAVNPIPQFGVKPRRPIIPVCEPTLSGNELKYITDAVETNWISSAGSYIRRFEALFAEKVGTRYGIACANGTVALHLALATLGLEPGDEVIIPTFTMIATANAVTYLGARPVLVDNEPQTWNMDVAQVEGEDHPAHEGRHARAHLWSSGGHGPGSSALADKYGHHSCWRMQENARYTDIEGGVVARPGRSGQLQLHRQQDYLPRAKAAW